MAMPEIVHNRLKRFAFLNRIYWSGTAADGSADLLKKFPHNDFSDEKNKEAVSELLYAELVYRRSYIQKDPILSNSIVQMNKWVDTYLKNGIVAHTSEEARKRGDYHDEAFGGQKAQYYMLQQEYAFVDIVTRTFSDGEFLPLQIALATLLSKIGTEKIGDRFTPMFVIKNSDDPSQIEQALHEYLELVRKQPETPVMEVEDIVTRALGKTFELDSATHVRVRDFASKSPWQALQNIASYTAKTSARKITLQLWQDQIALMKWLRRSPYKLDQIRRLDQNRFVGLGQGRVEKI